MGQPWYTPALRERGSMCERSMSKVQEIVQEKAMLHGQLHHNLFNKFMEMRFPRRLSIHGLHSQAAYLGVNLESWRGEQRRKRGCWGRVTWPDPDHPFMLEAWQ